ncbi:MAG: hypothetical protein LUD18_11605, partial [Lachnospiraceae bacterium]|nr:hypothetical protein [Lachnospiraceae bacterium]
QTIKQIMPLPAGMTVMIEFEDEYGKMYWVDCRDTPYSIGLALVGNEDGTYGGDAVLPYSFSDASVMNDNSTVINLMTCPHCRREMKPHLEDVEAADAYHTCDCGCTLRWFGEWVEEMRKSAETAENEEKTLSEKTQLGNYQSWPFDYTPVFEISKEVGEVFLSLDNSIPRKRYYFRSEGRWIGIDNHSGDVWVEAFYGLEECLAWLREEKEYEDDDDEDEEDTE